MSIFPQPAWNSCKEHAAQKKKERKPKQKARPSNQHCCDATIWRNKANQKSKWQCKMEHTCHARDADPRHMLKKDKSCFWKVAFEFDGIPNASDSTANLLPRIIANAKSIAVGRNRSDHTAPYAKPVPRRWTGFSLEVDLMADGAHGAVEAN